VIGLGLKFLFFSPPIAEAKVAGMDIAMMHAAASPTMPRQELNDMSFVFSEYEKPPACHEGNRPRASIYRPAMGSKRAAALALCQQSPSATNL
jgi:hypothetical protein